MTVTGSAEQAEATLDPGGVPGIATTLSAIGGKWKILILWHLAVRTSRYGELRRQIPGITEKMLIQQLRELEHDGIIVRKAYPEVPPRVEYSFTEYGTSLFPVLRALCAWGSKHRERVLAE